MQNLKLWKYISLPWIIFTFIFFIIFFILAFTKDIDIEFLSSTYLLGLFRNTILLSFGSAFISMLLAVPLAILVTFYKFPGCNFFSWALSLSIAFPAYVYAFIFVGIFEYSSPVSEFFRNIGIILPSIKNIFGASLIMSMALFPYIFLITKVQLSSVGIKIFRAAKSLGDSNLSAIRKVILPSLIPAIIGGMTLVIFEIIADFGGVSTLRIETFTVGIYDAWFGYQSYYSGARLAGYLLIFVFFIMLLSKYFVEGNKMVAPKTAELVNKVELAKSKQIIFTLLSSLIFLIVFCLPLFQLIYWQLSDLSINLIDNLYLLINSLILGVSVGVSTIFFAIALSLSYRQSKRLKSLISISTSGYAIPGSVISAGLLIGFDAIFSTSITFYGIFGLIICLSLRFMTPAYNYSASSLTNISNSAENALSLIPSNSIKAFRSFYYPQMKSALFLGFMIVFIESVKEQPATLLLRPVGFDTLSTKIYNFTSEGQWEMAASPSILLIFLSLLFVYLINKNIDLITK